MAKRSLPLNNISIASPCSMDWNQMVGNDSVRFCKECKLNVYNISQMNRTQAEQLISQTEGRLCIRYYERADGTVLVQDCPVGWQAVKQRMTRTATAAISAFLAFFGSLAIYNYFSQSAQPSNLLGISKPVPPTTPVNSGAPVVSPSQTWKMGDVAAPRCDIKMGKMAVRPSNLPPTTNHKK